MRDNWLIIYKHGGKQYREFGSFQRIKTIKEFAEEVVSTEFIG